MWLAAALAGFVGVGLGLGWGLWLLSRARVDHFAALSEAMQRESELREEVARLEATMLNDEARLQVFRSVSQEALATQTESLVQVADAKYGGLQKTTDALLAGHSKTITSGLSEMAERIERLEKERTEHAAALRLMVEQLAEVSDRSRKETANLALALRDNRVRGLWGETQLRTVLERSGLQRHVDFLEQRGASDGDTRGRPDVVVPLANGRCVVIDAKVPLDAYLEAANANEPAREREFQLAHAKAVGAHVKALASREYASLVDGAVDMVLLFLPGDAFLSAALDADPTLFETAAAKGVYLVTPGSLMPLLGGIAAGWQQFQAEQSALEIQQLGSELYDRIAVFAEHYAKVGKQLNSTVAAFNTSVGSLDTRLIPTARRLADRGAHTSRTVGSPTEIDERARHIRAIEPQENVRSLTEVGDTSADDVTGNDTESSALF